MKTYKIQYYLVASNTWCNFKNYNKFDVEFLSVGDACSVCYYIRFHPDFPGSLCDYRIVDSEGKFSEVKLYS